MSDNTREAERRDVLAEIDRRDTHWMIDFQCSRDPVFRVKATAVQEELRRLRSTIASGRHAKGENDG